MSQSKFVIPPRIHIDSPTTDRTDSSDFDSSLSPLSIFKYNTKKNIQKSKSSFNGESNSHSDPNSLTQYNDSSDSSLNQTPTSTTSIPSISKKQDKIFFSYFTSKNSHTIPKNKDDSYHAKDEIHTISNNANRSSLIDSKSNFENNTNNPSVSFSSPLTANAPHQSNIWSKLTPTSAEKLRATAKNFIIASNNEPKVNVPKVVASPENPFLITLKVLTALHHRMNLSLLDYLGGVNFIARVLKTDLINGMPMDEKQIYQRMKIFGKNVLSSASIFQPSLITSGTWMNNCRSYLNRQVFECEVIRGGERQFISSSMLLVGDIVFLKKGSMIPADGLYIDGDQLELDEGLVFCKSQTQAVNRKTHSANPFLFSLTEVVKGSGRMIVTCVGDNSTLVYYPSTLQFAIVFNNFSRAQKLINEKQFSVNIPMGREGYMLVHWVARYGTTQQMDFLFRNRVDLKLVTRVEQSSPLELALTFNQKLVHMLLAQKNPYFIKSNPNQKNAYGRTALFAAVRYGDYNLIRLLVSNNAKLTVVDSFGWTLLHYAVLYNPNNLGYLLSTQVFSRYLDHRDHDGNSALFYACFKGDIESATKLIQFGASVNLTNYSGRTILHFLAMGDPSPKFIYYYNKRYLIFKCGKKVIPKPKLKKGTSILEERLSTTCTIFNILQMIDFLIENKCDVNISDLGGLKPIHYCILASEINKDSGNAMRLFLSKKLNISIELGPMPSVSSFFGASNSIDENEEDDLNLKQRQEFFIEVCNRLISNGANFSIDESHQTSDAPLDPSKKS